MMRPVLTACAALAILFAAATVPGRAQALVTGIGDQKLSLFDDERFLALRVNRVRIVVPWNVALTPDSPGGRWIDHALELSFVPLVAFEREAGMTCPGAGCQAPSAAEYEGALVAFRQRWPSITELTPWNEPNHRSQPTFPSPRSAARYYNAARRTCRECTLVAGDVLDNGNLAVWLRDYTRALSERPVVWGVHNYYDATYFATSGVDALARATSGRIWLTETGGIVRFSPPSGGGQPYDERRAADSIRWLYAIARPRPRISRMYLYHWQGLTDHAFDSGLVGPRAEERPGLGVVRERVGLRAGPPPRDRRRAPASPVVARLSGGGIGWAGTRLRLRVACVSAPRRCRGRLVVSVPGRAPGGAPRLRSTFSSEPGRVLTRTLRPSAAVRRALLRQPRLQIAICLPGGACRAVQRSRTFGVAPTP